MLCIKWTGSNLNAPDNMKYVLYGGTDSGLIL